MGITQITPATLTTDMTALSTGITAFNAARAARTTAHATHRPTAEEECHILLIERQGTPNTGDPATSAERRVI